MAYVDFACGANAVHGARRSNTDKRRAVNRMLRDPEWAQWSDREIARQCAVGYTLVSALRSELSARGGQMPDDERRFRRKGKTHTQKTKKKRSQARC